GPGDRQRRGGPGGPPRGDLPDPGRRRSTGPNSVTVEAPRDVRFLAATVLVAVALAWACFARAALPTRVEGLRLMVASVLAALAFTPVGPRRRQGLLLGLLSAWLLLNLAASLGAAVLLLRTARPASSLAGVLLVLLLVTTNPVLSAWATGQTIILALGFWVLGALVWDRWRGLGREVGCAAALVIAGMIKPPLLIFPAAFGVRALGEAALGGL